ncbi:GNAT family N-acetyltransferase [bacterium]|nr:MAG: GNAT family N-acetyltransferase [bacterium]
MAGRSDTQQTERDLPQLRMVHPLAELPSERALPIGYGLRQATGSDAAAIGRVLKTAFGEPWSTPKVNSELLENDTVPATFVIENEDGIVATASYQLKLQPDLEAAWLHWVGALPSEKGKGLGEIVSRRVLQEAVERGGSGVYLSTDDFRLPAIRTYLRLGFEPDLCDASHPERWAAVMASLGSPSSEGR